jgi:hypothetical protein
LRLAERSDAPAERVRGCCQPSGPGPRDGSRRLTDPTLTLSRKSDRLRLSGAQALSQWEREALWVSRGINAVPAVVVEGKWLISGGQPAGVFEEALRGMVREGRADSEAQPFIEIVYRLRSRVWGLT